MIVVPTKRKEWISLPTTGWGSTMSVALAAWMNATTPGSESLAPSADDA
jgi:hypothetical protein